MIIVGVGTGRSGTMLWNSYFKAAGAQAQHEPFKHTLLDHRGNPETLAGLPWPEAGISYQFAALLPDLTGIWPWARWLWVRRDPYDTLASMIWNQWYEQDKTRFLTAPQAGEMGQADWDGLGQLGRCAWWVGFVRRQCELWLPKPRTMLNPGILRPGCTLIVDVGEHPARVMPDLGLPGRPSRRRLHMSEHPPLTGAQRREADVWL